MKQLFFTITVLLLLNSIGHTQQNIVQHAQPGFDSLQPNIPHGKIEPMIVVLPNGRAMKDDRASGNIMAPDKVQAFATFEKDLKMLKITIK